MASFSNTLFRTGDGRMALTRGVDLMRRLAPELLLFAAIGIELVVLAAWLPDTFDVWFRPDTAGYGDFPIFYRQGQHFSLNATYSPGLGVLMHPLAYFSMRVAFMIYTGVNVAAVLGVAFVAQRSVQSLPAKAAVALGVLALPQTHWAIRVGHFAPVLALAMLCGMMLAERRPVAAGLMIGVLALKPQYLPVPVLYFLWSRNWRALASSVGALFALGLAGIAVMVWKEGAGLVPYVAHYYAEAAGYIAHHLTAGQQDQIYVQGWQYSWYGFLVSAGLDPNPLIAADLMLLSLGGMLLAWWKCTPSVAKVATVLGMLLLTPHSTFYNWSMLSVAGVLLLRSDLRPRYLVTLMLVGLALAAAATQKATPFPVPVDLFRPAATRGLYWIQPAALAALFTLAIAGRKRVAAAAGDETAAEAEPAPRTPPARRAPLRAIPGMATFAAVAVVGLATGYAGGAYVTGSGPFQHDAYFNRGNVLSALPSDFPVPPASKVEDAGAGSHLPYRVEWKAPGRTSDVAGLMRQQLADGTWRIVESNDTDGAVRLRSARDGAGGRVPFVAEVDITPSGGASYVRMEFSPLPASLVPGYDRWLESVGLIVHNVEPGTDVPQRP